MIFEEKHFQITLFVYLYFVRYWGNVYSNLISYKKTDRWYYERVLRMDKRMDRRVLRVEKRVLRMKKQVLQVGKRVLQVVGEYYE